MTESLTPQQAQARRSQDGNNQVHKSIERKGVYRQTDEIEAVNAEKIELSAITRRSCKQTIKVDKTNKKSS